MRKSIWLLSAGLVALSAPAFAQETDTEAARPPADRGAPPKPRPSTTRRRARARIDTANHRHRDSPQRGAVATCRWRSARSPANAAEYRRDRHPRLQPGFARRSSSPRPPPKPARSRAHPRHRHGRRQPRPRKLGRGVHRRRLPLAHRRRPYRAWPDRPGRGAARPAGHLVRPQRLGRPDPRHHRQARVHPRNLRRGDDRQLRPTAARAAAPLARSPTPSRLASTASGCSATASSRTSSPAATINDRNRYMVRGQLLYRADRRSLGPADRRLRQAQ